MSNEFIANNLMLETVAPERALVTALDGIFISETLESATSLISALLILQTNEHS